MKKTISCLLASLMLLLTPVQQSQGQAVPAVCLVVVLAGALGVIYIAVKSCSPKYYYVHRPEGAAGFSDCLCLATTSKEMQLNGWENWGGSYPSLANCQLNYGFEKHFNCTNQVPGNLPSGMATRFVEETSPDNEPTFLIITYKSYDLVNWVVVDTFIGQESENFYAERFEPESKTVFIKQEMIWM